MRNSLFIIFLVLMSNILFAQSRYHSLRVGDRMPPLYIINWLHGEPVKEFRDDEIYVVEFSGSWCPPCRKAIPHLNDLAARYKGKVSVISIYLEHNNKNDTTDLRYVDNVRYLFSGLKRVIHFTVGIDEPQQTTMQSWGIMVVPIAFILAKSEIVWIGGPKDLDPILEKILCGTFDAEMAIKEQKEFSECLLKVLELKKNNGYRLALEKIDSLIKVYPYKNDLYYQKFGLLAGDDDKEAYNWLQWLLNSKIEGFDWPHFIAFEFEKVSRENRNYEMELVAIDRAIGESETKYIAANALDHKARTYAEMKDFRNAIRTCKKAIEYSQVPGGGSVATKRYKDLLVFYKYKARASVNIESAKAWLYRHSDLESWEIISHLISEIMKTPHRDYDLVLFLTDIALRGTDNANTKSSILSKKVVAYLGKGEITKAMECCQQALDISKSSGNQFDIDRYEKKMIALKELERTKTNWTKTN